MTSGHTTPLAIHGCPWVRPRRTNSFQIGRGTESCLVKLVYVAPLSAPFGGCCPRLRPLCKGRIGRCYPPVSRVPGLSPRASRRTRRSGDTIPSTPLCAAQARPARSFGHQKQVAGPKPSRFPRLAGGRPFSADPDDEGSRRPSTTGAGPASPGRLPVYPRRDGGSMGTGSGEGDGRGRDF